MKRKQKTLSLHRVEAVNISHAGKSEEEAQKAYHLSKTLMTSLVVSKKIANIM